MTLNFGLRRVFRWIFVIADDTTPIIGAGFLRWFGLLVDVKHHQLCNTTTNLSVKGQLG